MSLPNKQTKAQEAANKYAEIRAKFEKDRLKAWSSAPGFKIGSFDVYPLSLRSMIDLELAGNAFFTGSQILHGDIAAYIWRHMPEYDQSDPDFEKNYNVFVKRISKETGTIELIDTIQRHSEAAFADDPTVVEFGGISQNYTMPAIAGIAALCHEYGAAYGVNPVEVADIDLRIVFQCCRAIRMSGGKAKFSEPKSLREAKSDYINARNG